MKGHKKGSKCINSNHHHYFNTFNKNLSSKTNHLVEQLKNPFARKKHGFRKNILFLHSFDIYNLFIYVKDRKPYIFLPISVLSCLITDSNIKKNYSYSHDLKDPDKKKRSIFLIRKHS